MRVFVAGATSAVGQQLVPMLVARGHDVVGSTRTEARHALVRSLGAEAVTMDGLDAASVRRAVAAARPEVIVHQMTALSGAIDLKHFDDTFALTNRLRTEGTRHLLAAAAECGSRRVVAQSYTGWPNARSGGAVKSEDDPLDPEPLPVQRPSLDAIVELERLLSESAVEGVALRYGSLYGPGASDELVLMVRRRRLPVVGGGTGVWSWLHVEDAASATVAAVEGSVQGVFNVCDDEPAPVSEWVPYLADCVGAPPPRHVPAWLARLVIGDAGVAMMTEIRGSANARAKRDLGWRPRWATWRDGFRHALQAAEPALVM